MSQQFGFSERVIINKPKTYFNNVKGQVVSYLEEEKGYRVLLDINEIRFFPWYEVSKLKPGKQVLSEKIEDLQVLLDLSLLVNDKDWFSSINSDIDFCKEMLKEPEDIIEHLVNESIKNN